MGKVNKRPLHLVIDLGHDKKRVYEIDNYKSLSIMYSDYSNCYLISFTQFHKAMLVSTKHFNITGKVYTDYGN